MATIEVTTFLPASPEEVRQHIASSQLLRYVNAGLLSFEPREPPELPTYWSAGHYRVCLKLFGCLPIGSQTIGIENPKPGHTWVVRDNGHGSIARVWDHRIFVTAEGEGVRYTDHVTIEAGVLTPIVVLFAQLQYRYRQRRWRRLVSRDFRFDS